MTPEEKAPFTGPSNEGVADPQAKAQRLLADAERAIHRTLASLAAVCDYSHQYIGITGAVKEYNKILPQDKSLCQVAFVQVTGTDLGKTGRQHCASTVRGGLPAPAVPTGPHVSDADVTTGTCGRYIA